MLSIRIFWLDKKTGPFTLRIHKFRFMYMFCTFSIGDILLVIMQAFSSQLHARSDDIESTSITSNETIKVLTKFCHQQLCVFTQSNFSCFFNIWTTVRLVLVVVIKFNRIKDAPLVSP